VSAPPNDAVQRLDWDTSFWGVESARLHAADPVTLDRAVAIADASGIRWSSLLLPTTDLAMVAHAVAAGFRPVDVRVTLTAPVPPSTGEQHVPVADREDVEELALIARESLTISRFYADPNLPDDRCADFYETWVRNSVDGPMADAMVIARDGSSVDGFISVRATSDDTATIPLVAVRADRHGRGVGRALMADTLRWMALRGVRTADVTTQLANVAALRLYEAAGFRISESGVWLHRWHPRRTPGEGARGD
jgi:dTDP-4-amino-4,6-dideoxy-D-galactose acyltransferase